MGLFTLRSLRLGGHSCPGAAPTCKIMGGVAKAFGAASVSERVGWRDIFETVVTATTVRERRIFCLVGISSDDPCLRR